MTFELLPGTTNVYRFPDEERARPSLDLLRRIRPDVRTLDVLAEVFALPPPSPADRGEAAIEASALVAAQTGHLLDELVAEAVDSCRVAMRQAAEAHRADSSLSEAMAAGGYFLPPLAARAQAAARRAAELALAAHVAAERAEALALAIGYARAGIPIRAPHAEAEALFFGGAAAGRA